MNLISLYIEQSIISTLKWSAKVKLKWQTQYCFPFNDVNFRINTPKAIKKKMHKNDIYINKYRYISINIKSTFNLCVNKTIIIKHMGQ